MYSPSLNDTPTSISLLMDIIRLALLKEMRCLLKNRLLVFLCFTLLLLWLCSCAKKDASAEYEDGCHWTLERHGEDLLLFQQPVETIEAYLRKCYDRGWIPEGKLLNMRDLTVQGQIPTLFTLFCSMTAFPKRSRMP